jgi:hypothetical protein
MKLLYILLLLPALALACSDDEKMVDKLTKEGVVTVDKSDGLAVTCDTKKIGKAKCEKVMNYYRKQQSEHKNGQKSQH